MVGVVVITEDLEERTNAPGRHAGIVDRIGVTVADTRNILEQFLALSNGHVLQSGDQSFHRRLLSRSREPARLCLGPSRLRPANAQRFLDARSLPASSSLCVIGATRLRADHG